MKQSTRLFALLLTMAFCLSLTLPAVATGMELTPTDKAQALFNMGLFRGKGTNEDGSPDFALDAYATRNEAATMLIRLLGKELKAIAQNAAGALSNPFSDTVEWAAANVTWLYDNRYINGMDETHFGGDEPITAQQFAALLLRSLGYSEGKGDFTYTGALDFAVSKGILTAAQREAYQADFRREGMAEMCYHALYATMRESRLTLLERLTQDGIFNMNWEDYTLSPTTPVTLSLKYSGAGRESQYYVEEADVAPAVGDLDGDGYPEIIFFVRTVQCLDGRTGNVKWKTPVGHSVSERAGNRTDQFVRYCPPQIVDFDGDGRLDVVVYSLDYGTSNSMVCVYNASGEIIMKREINIGYGMPMRAAMADDLDGDGKYEVLVGFGVGPNYLNGTYALYVFNNDGTTRAGFPRNLDYGVYSNSLTTADIDGDGRKEIFAANDQERIYVFKDDGTPVKATGGVYANRLWACVPICESVEREGQLAAMAGYIDPIDGSNLVSGAAYEDDVRENRYIVVGTRGGILFDDMDGDGAKELVGVGCVMDGGKLMKDNESTRNNTYYGVMMGMTTYVLNADRTRYKNAALGYDWSELPKDIGEILSYDSYDHPNMEIPNSEPIAADLDGDGLKEILFASPDGMVHCFSLDKTEHGAWPYALDGRETDTNALTFASKPVAGDLNGDGKLEVVFATYSDTQANWKHGDLYVLDYSGKVLAHSGLPGRIWPDQDTYNCCQATPVLADVDGDGQLEIVLATRNCGVCVYDVM